MVDRRNHDMERLVSQLRSIEPQKRRSILHLMTRVMHGSSEKEIHNVNDNERSSILLSDLREDIKLDIYKTWHYIHHHFIVVTGVFLISFISSVIITYISRRELPPSLPDVNVNNRSADFTSKIAIDLGVLLHGIWPIALMLTIMCILIYLLFGIRRS